MNTEKLFWSIFNAKDEDALHKIVMSDELLSDIWGATAVILTGSMAANILHGV